MKRTRGTVMMNLVAVLLWAQSTWVTAQNTTPRALGGLALMPLSPGPMLSEPEPVPLDGSGPLPAFPGAEGFGSDTPGGRGGEIMIVTSLDDYNPDTEVPIPGTLRYALEIPEVPDSQLPYPRTIVFRVSGIIEPMRPLLLRGERGSFVTLAGQSAPGGGITITKYPLHIYADQQGRDVHDIVIRHLRFRNQIEDRDMKSLGDGIDLKGSYNVILDHISCSWSTDECISSEPGMFSNTHMTIQNSLIAEGLSNGGHQCDCDHSRGIEWKRAHFVSIHHNFLISNDKRNPKVTGTGEGVSNPAPADERIGDIRYNLAYNWGTFGMQFAGGLLGNIVGNVLRFGPDTLPSQPPIINQDQQDEGTTVYLKDNCEITRVGDIDMMACPEDQTDLVGGEFGDFVQYATSPFDTPSVTPTATEDLAGYILASAGALPHDEADLKFINDYNTYEGNLGGDGKTHAEIVVPVPALGLPPMDSDGDGMPNRWERAQGLDPNDPSDKNLDLDGDGYTEIEEYLNHRAERLLQQRPTSPP